MGNNCDMQPDRETLKGMAIKFQSIKLAQYKEWDNVLLINDLEGVCFSEIKVFIAIRVCR